jgi:hypothetical protein
MVLLSLPKRLRTVIDSVGTVIVVLLVRSSDDRDAQPVQQRLSATHQTTVSASRTRKTTSCLYLDKTSFPCNHQAPTFIPRPITRTSPAALVIVFTGAMSHPDPLFHDDPGIDPFLSGLGGDGGTFTPEQLDQLFAAQAPHTTSSTDSDFDDIFSRLDDDTAFTGSSSNDTTVSSTPEFTAFTFDGKSTSVYPTPSPVTPHPYPLQIQQKHHHYSHQQRISQHHTTRLSNHRSHTNVPTSDHGQYSRVHQPLHRRSLSQGDADRIAAATQQTQNPVFFRLQTPRSRSATPDEDGGRLNPSIRERAHRHRANADAIANQGAVYGHANSRTTVGTPMPTSAPVDASTVQRLVVPTNIGTPMGNHERGHRDADTDLVRGRIQLAPHTESDHPRFRYMDPQEQMRKSWRVIEVGAMAVVNKTVSHKPEGGGEKEEKGSKTDRMLEKLEEVEKHLKLDPGGREAALKGCAMIRGALEWKDIARKYGVEEGNKE